MRVRVTQVKPSNCFRLHPRRWYPNTQQSRFLTACIYRRLEKLDFTFHFSTQYYSFILDDVKLADIQQQFWIKECDFLKWGQNILWPPPTSNSLQTVIAVSYVQPPPGHASFHGWKTSAIEASMLQARACGTVYRRTCDETWTLRVSRVNSKKIYLGVSQPRRIVTVSCFAP